MRKAGLKKLRDCIDALMEGRKISGFKNFSLESRYEIYDIYNRLVRKEHPEFINSDVKEILDFCEIPLKEKGIGWICI